MKYLIAIAVFSSFGIGDLSAQEDTPSFKANVFYFSVGSYHYEENLDTIYSSGMDRLLSFPDYVMSAQEFAKSFSALGAKGTVIISSKRKKLSKNFILAKLKDFIIGLPEPELKSRNTKVPPIVMIYLFGHGFAGKRFSSERYLVPGSVVVNYNSPYTYSFIQQEFISQEDINRIIKSVGKKVVAFIFFDCCANKVVEDEGLYKYDSILNIRDSGGRLRYPMGLGSKDPAGMRQHAIDITFDYFPTFFSSGWGKLSRTVSNYCQNNNVEIGSICRRVQIILSKKEKDKRLFITTFRNLLLDNELDNLTVSPDSRAERSSSIVSHYYLEFSSPLCK